MYSITRKSKICETLQLCNLDGSVAHQIKVDINLDGFIAKYNHCREMLAAAQSELQKDKTSNSTIEAYGNAIIAIITLVFGEENAKVIIDFYENRYSEMLVDVFPFISEVIQPQIQKASKARMEQFSKMKRTIK